MAVEYKTWQEGSTELADHKGFSIIAEAVKRLPLTQAVRGHILVGGSGVNCQERGIICTPSSDFRIPREEVSSVTLCDKREEARLAALMPYGLFDVPVTEIKKDEYFQLAAGKARFYYGDMIEFLDKNPQAMFDTIFLLCFPKLWRELRGDLGRLVGEHLNEGGDLIGEGLFFNTSFTLSGFGEVVCEDLSDINGKRARPRPKREHHLAFIATHNTPVVRPRDEASHSGRSPEARGYPDR